MGSYVPPKSKRTFEQVEVNLPTPKETKEADISTQHPVKDQTTADILIGQIDAFIDLLGGYRNVETSLYAKEQLKFMNALDETIKQEYSVFTTIMDHLVNRVRKEPKAFAMDRMFVFTQLPEVRKAKNDNYIQKHIALMSALVTLGRNLRDRQRVGRQIDVVILTKGYYPKAAQNIQNYLTKTYG